MTAETAFLTRLQLCYHRLGDYVITSHMKKKQ